MISSMYSSKIARRARAPVFFSSALSAIASNAPSSKSNLTSSRYKSFWYCFKMAFFGSLSIWINISLSNPFSVKMIGRRPTNSGIIPNALTSSTVTLPRRSGSSSYLSLRSARKPMDACSFRRSLMMFSNSGNAPPQINKIFRVFTVVRGTIAFLLVAPTGTSTSLPSSNFNRPCCTASPLTSLWLVFLFFASLSISSIKMIPCSAFSTSLSAANKSFETTLSISSPI